MSDQQPSNLRLPTPGCYADPDRSGLTAENVFDGMTEHLVPEVKRMLLAGVIPR